MIRDTLPRLPRPMPNPQRRSLSFDSLDEALFDVDRLVPGHVTVGNWSLAQICNHLALAIAYSVDGYPGQAPWLFRRTIGPLMIGYVLRTGRMPQGVYLPRKFHPKPGLDARSEAESLRTTIRRFTAYTGPHADHPFGARLNHGAWNRFHVIHAAHHLSFAVPAP